MARKSGGQFSGKDHATTNESRAHPGSISSGCALGAAPLSARPRESGDPVWIPAFAGMSGEGPAIRRCGERETRNESRIYRARPHGRRDGGAFARRAATRSASTTARRPSLSRSPMPAPRRSIASRRRRSSAMRFSQWCPTTPAYSRSSSSRAASKTRCRKAAFTSAPARTAWPPSISSRTFTPPPASF